jgi:hypothetical protein
MKRRLIVTIGLILTSIAAFAALRGSPYFPELDQRFVDAETSITTNAANITALQALPANVGPTTEGISNLRIARVTYDVATDLGTVGAHGLGVSLPAKAVIIRSWFMINTQFVDAGSGTVALSCEDANNIKTATDITGEAVGAFVEGASTGAASAFISSIAATCEITATVATAAQTAGKLTLWVMYVVAD